MKKIILVTLLLLNTAALLAQTGKTKIYINSFINGSEAQKKDLAVNVTAFEERLAIRLSEVYSCSYITTKFETQTQLDMFRVAQLIGTDSATNEKRWGDIASNLDCKYLVAISVKPVAQNVIVSLMFANWKETKTLFRTSATTSRSSFNYDFFNSMASELLDGIKDYEICPFKGWIKLKVISELKENTNDEYSVYCNGMDGNYKKTTSIKNYSEANWNIEKIDLEDADGNVTFNLSEETKIDEINPCFDCSPTKQGPRISNEKTVSYAVLNGLSDESEKRGIKINDARAKLTFLENGNYLLRVKGSTSKGKKKTIKTFTAEGACQNKHDKPDTTFNAINAGINEILGEFVGNARSKILEQKGSFEKENPNTNQKEKYLYEFYLKRD